MNKIKNAFVGLIGAALVLTMVPVTNAQTSADFQAQIAALLAQVQALTAQLNAGAAVTATFTRDLTLGSTGADVLSLQRWLNANGYVVASVGAGSPGMETSYFGPATRAAVARYQAAKNISPAVGYFGPITRAAVNAQIAGSAGAGTGTGTGTTPPPADDEDELEGGAGSINDADFISDLNNEEVGEGEEDAEVAGLEIEADDGSDIELTAVRLVFVHQANVGTSSNNFDRYADEVSLWLDGEEVARVDADDFNEDPQGTWSRTISLDSGAIIRMGDLGDLVAAISAVNNLDSDDEAEDWTVEFASVRFRDAQNAVISDTTTGDIGGATRQFSFETLATSANTEFKISAWDAMDDPAGGVDVEVNEAHVIDVHATADTDGVPVLAFTVEIEGNSDVWMDELPVEFDSTGMELNDAISSVHLIMDGDEIGTENMVDVNVNAGGPDDEIVTFDDLDTWLEPGTYEFLVTVDFNSIADGIADGDTVAANIGATERAAAVLEDEGGDDLAAADRTGTVIGDAHGLFDVGIIVDNVVVTETKTVSCDGACGAGEDEQAEFKFTFDVTAFGGNIFIDDNVELAGDGHTYATLGTDAAAVGGTSVLVDLITSPGTDAAGTSTWQVDEDETRGFIITVNYTAGDDLDEFVTTNITAIQWNDADVVEGGAGNEQYNFNMEDFESDPIFLNSGA